MDIWLSLFLVNYKNISNASQTALEVLTATNVRIKIDE
jgi:hypothetical protein